MTDRFGAISFVASETPEAQAALDKLVERYGNADPAEAGVVVALGGDGLMLQTLHRFLGTGKPIYGMNRGSVGFLMNEYHQTGLRRRLEDAKPSVIHPLRMRATDAHGFVVEALAINEVSMLRQSYQAAKLRVMVDGRERLEELSCDGLMVATPVGSTAYNFSAHGPILPFEAPLLAMTPVSPFRPRRWRGALLPDSAVVEIHVLEPEKRPVNAVADHQEVKSVRKVEIQQARDSTARLLSDRNRSWSDRILAEQFAT